MRSKLGYFTNYTNKYLKQLCSTRCQDFAKMRVNPHK
jgi:hypothetical protein